MSFSTPQAFWLFLLVGGLALLDRIHRTVTSRLWPHITRLRAHDQGIDVLAQTEGHETRWRLWAGLGLLVVGLAGPRVGHVRQPVEKSPREVIVALDLSRSMLARDVKPSRLDHAKLLTSALLEKNPGDRVGLVLFSASAYLQLPLSDDYQIFSEMLSNLSPAYFPQSGTNFGAMLKASLAAFGKTTEADRFLVVISDGEAFDSDWKATLDEFKARGIHVVGIGIGTSGGDVMLTDDGPVRSNSGEEAVSRIKTSTLEQLASATGGSVANGSSWVDIASLLKVPPGGPPKKLTYAEDPTRFVERYRWAIVPALLLLAWSFWVELPVRPSTRNIRLPAPRQKRVTTPPLTPVATAAATATAAALLVLLMVATPVGRSQDMAEQKDDADRDEHSPIYSLASLVSQRINGILAKPQPNASDCVSLVIDIVAYCENTLRARQRFPVSIIDDALKAVDWGERLDPHGGDWPKLRNDLRALLKADVEPWKTARPDAAGTSEVALGYDASTEMKNDKHSSGRGSSDPTDASEIENAKSNFADNAAFGDMTGQPKEHREPEPPPVASDEQLIGGKKTKADEEREEHPELVMPLQKLEHVRHNDTPAKLFQMLEGKRVQFVSPTPEW